MNDYVLLKTLAVLSFFLLVLALEGSPKRMHDTNTLKNKNGYWIPVHISLLESSGSVAPEFRYALDVSIEATSNGFVISRRETEAGKEIENSSKKISEKKYTEIVGSLLSLGAHKFKKENLPEEKILGVNYNEFSCTIDGKESHFYYLLKNLETENFKIKKQIIQIMKGIKP